MKHLSLDLLSPFVSSFERREMGREREREGKKIRAVTHYPRDSVPYPRRERKRGGKKKRENDENRRRGAKEGGVGRGRTV